MPEFYMNLARKIIKIWKYPNFYDIWTKNFFLQIPEFYMIFARKMSEFYTIIAWTIFFPNFRRPRHVPPCPPSPTPISPVRLCQ